MHMRPNEATHDAKARLRQGLAEHDLIEHVKHALRLAINWDADEVGLNRKITSVRFCTESLARHMQLIMEIEEQDGEQDDVADMRPSLFEAATLLRHEHESLRAQLSESVALVSRQTPDDPAAFAACCQELECLLSRLDRHEAGERKLLFDMYCEDDGGEAGGG
jgi:hypothetical protein